MARQKALTLIKSAVLQLKASRDPTLVRHIADLARSDTIPPGDDGYEWFYDRMRAFSMASVRPCVELVRKLQSDTWTGAV